MDYCKEQYLNSEIDCFHSKSKTLGFLENKAKGSGMAMVALLVSDLADSFNIGKNMSAAQVTDVAMLIVNDYPELKLDDIAFCFTKAKKGSYGKVYDRLDSAIIFGWLEMFIADKLEQIEYYWQHNQRELKRSADQKLISAPAATDNETALHYIKKITKTVNDITWRNKQLRKITTAEPVKEYLIRDIHQLFIKEFKLLYKMESWAEDRKTGDPEFITCCGKKLDIGEYIEKKHKQLMAYREKINYRWGIHPEPNLEEVSRMLKGGSDEVVNRIKEAKAKGEKFIKY